MAGSPDTTMPAASTEAATEETTQASSETTVLADRSGGMVPPSAALPEVLPTERLKASGKPARPLRDDLRRIASWRNAGTVASVWAMAVGLAVAGIVIGHPLAWVVVFVLFGPVHARFAILAHEAAHRLLFSNRRANDLVGQWLLSAPTFIPFRAYRRSHFAHHKDEFGPREPDMGLYVGYPISRESMGRKLGRDASGISGYKNLKGLFSALHSPSARPVALRILGVQVVIVAVCALAGYPALYLVWLGSWLTVWRVLNRLRAIAEHGGMKRSADRRETTHHVRQGWLARFWVVPYHTGWHLAHHTDMGVPWRNLPAFQAELDRCGWVTPELVYPSYTALWRALASGGSGSSGEPAAG